MQFKPVFVLGSVSDYQTAEAVFHGGRRGGPESENESATWPEVRTRKIVTFLRGAYCSELKHAFLSCRFRSAKDAEEQENAVLRKGETLPDVQRFDSNCITPGTSFMARLQSQLKYFVASKISSDKSWQKVKVILSGHEVRHF